jgi:hypothetical protein
MPLLSGILCLRLLAAPAAAGTPAPAAYQEVLDHRSLDVERLRARGFAFEADQAFRVDATGRPAGPALTPAQLDAALAAGAAPTPAPRAAAPVAPRSDLAQKLSKPLQSLGALYDGTASATSGAIAPDVPAPAAPRPPRVEAPFDASWSRIQAQLRDPSQRVRGLRALAARFRKDPQSATGLNADAPEALRLLTLTIHAGGGGLGARADLRRDLAMAANLTEFTQKAAFARALTSPITVYVALGQSQASHSLDSQLYFKRMDEMLSADGQTLSAFIDQEDPTGREAATFLLRAHAYDALLPYLFKHPAEAGALAPRLFPDGRGAEIREHASHLEGLMTQLAEQGKRSGALEAFVQGLLARAAAADPATADRIAVYLKVNEPLLPKKDAAAVDALAARLPPGLLEGSGLFPAEPYDVWPAEQWTFVLHFASTGAYQGWQRQFRARGYAPESDAEGATLVKNFDGLKIRLRARLYPGDKEGFMRGAVAQRFLSDVSRDLRDPAVQGVILRNHAQFKIANLFGKGVTPGKLIQDGACRSAWDLQTLRHSCPTCSFIVNTGTGHTHENAASSVAVIEGLANREGWPEIGEEWKRLSPSASRIQGPWTPPYGEALAVLDELQKPAAKKP